MAEALKVKISSDSSEFRGDIDKNIKKMQELSSKYKEVNDKLSSRGPEDFAKTLSKALEKNNEQLEKAKQKLTNLEEAYNKQAAKAHELSKGDDNDAYDKALQKQQQLETKMLSAKEEVNKLEEQSAQITAQTTNEYNAQTEALKAQAEELKNSFNILDAINNQDMKYAGTYSFFDGLKKKAKDVGSWLGDAFKEAGSKLGDIFKGIGSKVGAFLSSGKDGQGIELFKKGSFQEANNGFKSLTGLAGKFGLAMFGAQTAFTLIRKAVSQILEDNTQLSNTISSIWNGLVSAITPVVNAIVSVLATALNYIIAMINAIASLDVLGLMSKANKKANAKSSSGSSSKQNQQYSFDTAETLQKSSGGGSSGTSIEDSYLKNVELSGDLLRYAEKLKAIWADIQQIGANLWEGIKEGLQYMNSGERILQVCKNLIDAFLDDIKACTEATVEWSAKLDFGPLFDSVATALESLEPILTAIGDAAVWIYTNAILPIATWIIENGIPEFLNTVASVLDVVNTALEQMKEPLQYIWDNFISPIATTIGDVIINAFKQIQEYMDKLGTWLSDHPEFVEFVTLVGSLVGIVTALVAGFELVSAAVGVFASVLTSPIVIIAAIIAAIGLLLVYFGDIDAAVDNLKLVFQGLTDFITGVFTGNWDLAWQGCLEIFEGFSGLLDNLCDAIVNMFESMGIDISGVIDGIKQIASGLVEFIAGVFTGDWKKAWEGVKDIFKGLWNGIISLLESAINWIVDGINKISFDVPSWVPVIGGKQFGFNISHASLPRLAQGAVIPPNKEFLAVLGDQTRGNNIETPEALLRQVVQEESGSQEINIVANGDMAQLIKLLRFKLQEEDKRVGSSLVVGG